jgi:hypothetical protein
VISLRKCVGRDATLKGYPLSVETIRVAFIEICAIQLDDKVNLMLERVTPIRDQDEYDGYRAFIIAKYETIQTPLKIDITTGDIITPQAVRYALHSNFENKLIEIWTYNTETILAEKVEMILRRSVPNTRP